MKRAFVVFGSLLGIIILLSLVRIGLSNAFSTDGITLDTMQGKIASLERENMILKEKLYTLSSYTNISEEATALGFVENKSTVALGGVQPLAIKQ